MKKHIYNVFKLGDKYLTEYWGYSKDINKANLFNGEIPWWSIPNKTRLRGKTVKIKVTREEMK